MIVELPHKPKLRVDLEVIKTEFFISDLADIRGMTVTFGERNATLKFPAGDALLVWGDNTEQLHAHVVEALLWKDGIGE